jgi:hypothetical protein
MPSILLTVFILQLIIHIVNTIGASTINNLVRNAAYPLPPGFKMVRMYAEELISI